MTITFYNWAVLPQFSQECTSASQSFSSKPLDWACCKRRQITSPLAIPFAGSNTTTFLLWGFVKDSIYLPQLLMSFKELRDRIMHALRAITAGMLHRVWDEFDYRVDVCHVTKCAHIEGL